MATSKVQSVQSNLDLDGLNNAIKKIERRIASLRDFDPSSVNSESAWTTQKALSNNVKETLIQSFGENTIEFEMFKSAADFGYTLLMGGTPVDRIISDFQRNKEGAIRILTGAVELMNERILDHADQPTRRNAGPANTTLNNKKVFVVHGHDEGAKNAVARFLEKLGFDSVILHEQPNGGKTVIEKFETHSDVGFAVVLMTPDDVGSKKDQVPLPRARQNVVLELGYFLGKLGRSRIAVFKRNEVEVPTDFAGVVYEPYDDEGAWKIKLATELGNAGYDIDWNKVMKSQ